MLAQLAVLMMAGCSGAVQGDVDDDEHNGVPCEQAVDGDPCDQPGDHCGISECYGCYSHCAEDGRWRVECTEAPTCGDVTIAQGEPCDGYCVQLTCGPFDTPTACGQASVQAACSSFGWFYELPCDPDCESLSESACRTTTGCTWAVPCSDNPYTAEVPPRCIDFPPRIGTCQDLQCSGETTCVEVSLSHDPSSGDCDGGGALVPLCVAP